VTVGGQEFAVVIDTGSSDPWLAPTNFLCFDPESKTQVPEAQCEFGRLYNSSRSASYRAIANQNFNISYADGEYLYGSMATETFQMAGIVVTNQTFATVNVAAWYGDLRSSGLFGFAYRTLTSAYRGVSGKQGGRVLYDPLFVNMYKTAGVAPVFAMALDRDISAGGVIAIGGLPDVPTGRYQARTRVVPADIKAADGSDVYQFYTIDIDGFAISDRQNARFTRLSPNPNPEKTPLQGGEDDVIVDSGTTLIYAPNSIAVAVAAAFSPAGYYDDAYQVYRVECDAKSPVFGVSIAGKIFFVNPVDMIVNLGTDENGVGFCVMGVQPNLGGLSILGGVFMKNVLSVFDVGSQEMRFSARQFYQLSR
jgi:aspergillopepsin I